MKERQMESLSDIEADIRERADCAERHGDRETHNDGVATLLRSIADRIEAVAKRDAAIHAMTCEANERLREHLEIALEDNEKPVGNAAAMREALVWMSERMNAALHEGCLDCDEALGKIDAALSAPARQCDVGTAEEQGERCLAQFNEWRRKSNGKKVITAIMEWAQTPYAEEGAGK